MAENKCYEVRVAGDVQGVNFRSFAKRVADALGLVGFVENTADGSVRIEVRGDEETIKKFIARCRSGPAHAAVRSVRYEERAPTDTSHLFTIRR